MAEKYPTQTNVIAEIEKAALTNPPTNPILVFEVERFIVVPF